MMTNHPTPVILDDEALAEIEARASAATDGPWQRGGNYWDQNTVTADAGKYFIADCHKNPMSAEFIAHARTDIPALCATVRALRAEREAAMRVLNPSMPENGLEDACRQRVQAFISCDDNCDELEKQNTALREQLAEASKNLRIRRDLIRGWQQHIQRMATILDCEALDIKVEQAAGELQSQLAQVEKERDDYRERLLQATETKVEI